MYCPNCGCYNPDQAPSCGQCNAPLNGSATAANQQPYNQQPYNQQYNQQPYNQQYNQQPYNQQYNQQPYYQQSYNTPVTPQHPMKWFKFLIYFALFLGAVMNFASAVTHFTGAQYTNDYGYNVSDFVYSFYSGLQIVDILMGIACLGLAVFAIVTRFRLAGYRKDGPKFLLAQYAIVAVLNVVYLIAAIGVTGLSFDAFDSSGIIIQVLTSVVMIICNKIYFDKRKDLFTK